jgi:hypothetical protein
MVDWSPFFMLMGEKGDPDAKIAEPSVHAIA